MHLELLLGAAARINADYRGNIDERELELGFLYGTAELVLVTIGLLPEDSYSERREAIAKAIDDLAVTKKGAPYALLDS